MNTTANTVLAAIDDAQRLVSWAEVNNNALLWEPVEEAFLRALGTPVPHEFAHDMPLLRFANGTAPISLLDAVLGPPIPRKGRFVCDVTGTKGTEPNTLWIPAGRSVVQLTVRNHVRGILADLTRTRLVWS